MAAMNSSNDGLSVVDAGCLFSPEWFLGRRSIYIRLGCSRLTDLMTNSCTPVTGSADGAWIHIYQSPLY